MSREREQGLPALATVRIGNAREIAGGIAREHGLTFEAIVAADRRAAVSAVRQAAMLALHRRGFRVTHIARVLRRDRGAVLFGIERAKAREAAAMQEALQAAAA